MAESGGLLNRCTTLKLYPGFESLPHRQPSLTRSAALQAIQLHRPALGDRPPQLRERVGDLVQSRHNTDDIRTSEGRRVLNRDTWIITGHNDAGVTARHTRDRSTVTFTPDYLDAHVELAYAVTIAGAQGRTTDTAHTIVSPRTQAAGLYVGMTRGRLANHAHVIQDGHLHDELGLGHLDPTTAFAAAIVRNPDGETSAHRVRDRWPPPGCRRMG